VDTQDVDADLTFLGRRAADSDGPILWPTFLPPKVSVYFNHFYVIHPESYRIRWNYCYSRSPSL